MGSDAKKGYGALSRRELLEFDPDDLILVTDPDDPSGLFDERALAVPDPSLVANILEIGVRQPIVVKKYGFDEGTGKPIVKVVDGRQRVLAARAVNAILRERGADTITVEGVPLQGADDRAIETLIGTGVKVRPEPLRDARLCARYLDRKNHTPDAKKRAAALFGVDVRTIENWASVVAAHPDVTAAVEAGRIPFSTAVELVAKVNHAAQPKALAKMVAAGVTKGAAAKNAVSQATRGGEINLAPAQRMRPRRFVLAFRDALKSTREKRAIEAVDPARIVDFLLGDDAALDGFDALQQAAVDAGWSSPGKPS